MQSCMVGCPGVGVWDYRGLGIQLYVCDKWLTALAMFERTEGKGGAGAPWVAAGLRKDRAANSWYVSRQLLQPLPISRWPTEVASKCWVGLGGPSHK